VKMLTLAPTSTLSALLLGEALGGQPLIAGESSLVRLIANVEGRHRQIEELSIHGPRPLLWILRRALHPDREERTSHADLFRDQLQAWLDDQPIPGYSYSLLEKAEGFIRRRPTLTLGWISALILILLSWQLWNAIIDLENRAQALRQAEGDEARAKAEAERARRIVDDLNEARSHAKKGLLRELEEKLTAALAESQRSESVLLSAAEIWKSVGSNAKSCELLEEAAKRFSPAFEALFERHRIEVNGQSGLQSSPWLSELIRRARELGLENEYTLYEDARNAFYQGDLQLALTMTNKALTFNRKLSMIFNLQAVICHKLQRPEEAQKNFDIAVELDPLFCGARINRGNFRMSFNQYSEAMTDYNKAIEIEGNNKEAYVNRGVLRKRAGDFAGARSDYDRAIELDPDFKEAFCNRAILLAQQTKDSASALADLDRALSLDPRFKDALFHRGKLQIQRGALSEALRDFDQALEVDGRQPFVLQERALLKLRQNDLRGACADFDVALEIDPELTLSLVNRGLTLERLGENQRALADFEAFLTRSPQHSSAAMIRQKIETLRQRGITSND
jgi:tetratricopeptide (TPR) repeat protein